MVRGLAHEWSSKPTSKFVETQLGLPAAAEALAAARVDGRGLLLLSDELLQRYGIERPLHRRKILAHAEELRDEAFAAVNAARSEDPQQWNCWETAAWAAVEKQSPKAAMLLLKRGHTFKGLCAMNKEELQQALKPVPSEERHHIMLELLQCKVMNRPTSCRGCPFSTGRCGALLTSCRVWDVRCCPAASGARAERATAATAGTPHAEPGV